MALTSAHQAALGVTVASFFRTAFNRQSPLYRDVCMVVPSNRRRVDMTWVGAPPTVSEWLDRRIWGETRAADFNVTAREWSIAERVLRSDLEDDNYGHLQGKMESLAARAAGHADELLVSLLDAGESEATYDEQPLFSNSHGWGDSGNNRNLMTGSATTGTTPDATEFKAATHDMLRRMLKFKDDQGKLFNGHAVSGNGLGNKTLLIPTEMVESYDGAFLSGRGAGGADNRKPFGSPDVKVIEGLADPASFYLADLSSASERPFYFHERRNFGRFTTKDDPEDKWVKFFGDARYEVAPLYWHKIVKYTFT